MRGVLGAFRELDAAVGLRSDDIESIVAGNAP